MATKAAKSKRRNPTVEQTAVKPKSIVLFSDGTGNSSAKLFKTNVWRLYEAVDLGLPDPATIPPGQEPRVQVALYDNGVGTSTFRPLAIFGGIFGLGLKKNVLHLYRYACRNYQPGTNGQEADKIYAFGFSRGAFTIRLVAALIATKGIVQYETEAELKAWSADLFRAYQRDNNPNFVRAFVSIGRGIRDRLIAAKRWISGLRPMPKPHTAEIAFLGVWDTVAAYGGPSAEITRAIDNFLWPLTMTNQKMCDGIKIARHALALDDERDSFLPIPWDELDWSQKAQKKFPNKNQEKERQAYCDRLQQVWFAGMHSDVGGGYPDESLSYVSLLWMMAEAQKAKLRLIPSHVERVNQTSNSLGPIHDSRKGPASYYRYQPRKIAAFLHPQSGMDHVAQTKIMRDPVLGEKQRPPHGYLLSCKIHESVAARIAFGTDDYAPIVLPERVEIEPYSTGFTRGSSPRISQALHDKLVKGDPIWSSHHETVFDVVWARRLAYFTTSISSLLLAATPLFAHRLKFPETTDNRWVFERLTGWTKWFPEIFQPWVRAFETSPLLFWILIALVIGGMIIGNRLESKIHSRMKDLWKYRLSPPPHPSANHPYATLATPSFWQRFRNNEHYQRGGQIFKWYLLPIYVGLAFLGAVACVPWLLGAQFRLTLDERTVCQRNALPVNKLADGSIEFDTKLLCNATGREVVAGHRYVLEIAMPASGEWNWRDAKIPATPEGLSASRLGLPGFIGAPLRRLADAQYLQPLYQVRPPDRTRGHQAVLVSRLHPVFYRDEMGCRIYRADFTPTESGKLFLYVNDAVGLIKRDFYYSNNYGKARIHLHDLSELEPLKPRILNPGRCAIGGVPVPNVP